MPLFQQLRWLYRMVFVGGFVMIGFALYFSSAAVEFAHGLPEASRTYGLVSGAFGMAGMLIGFCGKTLGMIVLRIEALETKLAKFVESDDPKSAGREFAKFLRTTKPFESD